MMRTTAFRALLIGFCLVSCFASAQSLDGQHFPHGWDAVRYLYGPEGTWRDQSGLSYQWNYYEHCATSRRPADRLAVLSFASTNNATAPDANCLILADADNDGSIADDLPSGYAFHEHAGRGVEGLQSIAPFYQFWFDDNWLARYMAAAYDQPSPAGLHDKGYPIRWRPLGGDNSHFTPYPSPEHIDQIALNGLYRLNAGDFIGALLAWGSISSVSGAAYNWVDQRYDYPQIRETYHLGLWAILSERLLSMNSRFWNKDWVLQHAMSARSHLLSLQERDVAGKRLGWRTGIGDPATVINTETTAIAVLALGAKATWVLEPGHAPLQSAAGNYFLRPHNALSAVTSLSSPGHIVYGPYWELEPGTYSVEFSLRTPSSAGRYSLATLDVYDGSSILNAMPVTTAMMPGANQWRRFRLDVNITNTSNSTEFRIFWHGQANLDVGPIRVLKR